ncbi:hypothetical protein HYALB_00000290 [Hymenoscyphus albidus]|uniref:Cnl2/NKP2 family protein n=1 Tax=Hymenoscyphus albidus TaxID=595503 RepID=A0A9N9Q9M7_9HELO|nr:hypothetical protein HYALB_00000290 [Hymenoscyphus albidus]
MPPTESKILTTYLLLPSPLPSILPPKSFPALFPKSQQSSPQIQALYRDLLHQRALVVDAVAHNVAAEVKRGHTQKRLVARSRRQAEKGGELGDEEVEVEEVLFKSTANLPTPKPHTLFSIIPALEEATALVEDEIQRLDAEAEELLREIESTVGGLSDLRYGKLANGKLPEEVLGGLRRLEDSCKGS